MCLEIHDGLLERPIGLRGIFTRVSHAQRVSDLMAEHLSERGQILQGRCAVLQDNISSSGLVKLNAIDLPAATCGQKGTYIRESASTDSQHAAR